MLPDPELVTLIEEEEEPLPPISPELRVVRDLVINVSMLIGLKIAMIVVSRRVVKSVRELNKTNIPKQYFREEEK